MNLGPKAVRVLKELHVFQVFLENNGLKAVQITLDPLNKRGQAILGELKSGKVGSAKSK